MFVVASRRNPWARRRRIELAELLGEPWIFPARSSWNYGLIAEAFRAQNLAPPSPSVVTFSVPLRISLLLNGPYITVFPRSVVRLAREQDELKVLPVEFSTRPSPVVILTLKIRTLSPVVERFIQCTREVSKSFDAQARAPKR